VARTKAGSEAASEPALEVESREDLIHLLGQACEIEHGLMCEYLFAQFSLKRGLEEGLTPKRLQRVQAWERALISVIKQEMLHLALSTNILTAIGAAPHFERPNFPILCRWYPPGVHIVLLPFGEQALRHFMFLERPEGMKLDDAAGLAAVQQAEPVSGPPGVVTGHEQWQTVGHLYRGIEAGLATLCERYGEDSVFIGPTEAQAVTDIFEWPELVAVTDLASANRAIETIVEQGEGACGDWTKSHFGTFAGILYELLTTQATDPHFSPSRPVEPSFVRLPPDVASGTLIEDPTAAQLADLTNKLYEVVLQVLCRYYIHQGEAASELDVLARTAKHLMNWIMRELGPVLTSLPVGPSFPDRTVGPTFDINGPALFVLPHREPSWKIIRERLDGLEHACAALAERPGLETLGPLVDKLHSMSGDIGAQIAPRHP
jgi:Ferritin-like